MEYNKGRADSYDKARQKIAAIKDALHLCMRLAFVQLRDEAHILYIGVATGAELIELAEVYPAGNSLQWNLPRA